VAPQSSGRIALEQGDQASAVFTAEGELRHWSEGRAAVRAASRDDVAGLYDVGDGASFDLTDVRPLEVTASADTLTVRLDEHTTLHVDEQEDAPA
jgi:hypothetical protein